MISQPTKLFTTRPSTERDILRVQMSVGVCGKQTSRGAASASDVSSDSQEQYTEFGASFLLLMPWGGAFLAHPPPPTKHTPLTQYFILPLSHPSPARRR